MLEGLIERFPGRETQIEMLHNLLGDGAAADAIFVHGGPSVGKTSIVKAFLEEKKFKHAVANLIECYSTKILLETILNELTSHRIDPTDPQPVAKCDNLMDFLNNLSNFQLKRAVIVLDKAEQLRNMDFNLLPSFLRLRELSGIPSISVILISEIAFQKFNIKGNVVDPVKLSFPQYSKEEIIAILAMDFDTCSKLLQEHYDDALEVDVNFYLNYLNVFLSTFYRACRDLCELRYMARINFVKYCEPIHRKDCCAADSMALWRHIAPTLKSSLEVLYLRFSGQSGALGAQALELPFYAKYLLIAAYLASYNPAKDDKRLFMKHHGKKTKTMKDVKAKSKVSEQLSTQLGPKPFSFDRLLAIFYAILDDKVGFNNNLLVQVSSLVELQLLTSLSDNYNLDGQKYKCTVNFEFIQTISKMVGFNIRKYLSDFSHI